LFSDQKHVDAVAIGLEIRAALYDPLQRFVAAPLAIRFDPLHHHAQRLAAKRHQDGLIRRRRHRAHTRNCRELRREGVVVPNGGARMGQRDMCLYAKQAVLEGLAESGVHGEGDDQSGHAGGYA
jgi:hypothetical protein